MRMRGRVGFYAVKRPAWTAWWSAVTLVVAAAVASGLADDPWAVTAAAPPQPGQAVYSIPIQERLLSFAVNVDWGGELLPRMLALFERHDARVTFFPTGRWAAMEPELVQALVRAGHELGNHGWRHDHPKALGDEALRDHIVRNQRFLRDLTGVETRLYAPPYGEVDARIARIAAEEGHWTIMWTIDTVDWQRPDPDVIVRRIVPRAQPGAIVLMHPTEPTLAALPTVLDMLTQAGWRVVPVGELLERAGTTSPGDAARR